MVTMGLRGMRPYALANIKFFCRFSDEIQSVPPAALPPATRDCWFHMQQGNLYVVSLFGLIAGVLQKRNFYSNGFVSLPKFISVIDVVNWIALTTVEGKALHSPSNHGAHELKTLQTRIAELASETKKLEMNSSCLNLLLPSAPPLVASSQSHTPIESESNTNSSISSIESSVMEETLNSSSLGPTAINRKMA